MAGPVFAAEGAVVSGVFYTVGYGVSKIDQGIKGKASAKKAVAQKASCRRATPIRE